MDLNNLGTVIIVTQSDMDWLMTGERCFWELPEPALAIWRRRPFRWVRAWIAGINVEAHDAEMRRWRLLPSGYDRWVIYAIRRGWC